MPTIDVVDQKNQKVGTVELADDVFGIRPHMGSMYDVVRSLRAKARAGTASTLTRSETSYSTAKPYRQKGTGRARAGSRGSPLWRGGGVVFGPKPRKYIHKVPRKVRRLALRSALSGKVQEGNLKVIDRIDLDIAKTQELVRILNDLELQCKTLIVTGEVREVLMLSGRNIPHVAVLPADSLNVYDLLNMEKVLITRNAVDKVAEALSS
jgi:large subunit ribosomal protein L4